MSYLVITLVSLLAATLTFFSGFGLGTLLLPAFSLFFPVEVAIAATACVHFANSLFKVALVGKLANWRVVFRFAVPGLLFSFLGAYLLMRLGTMPPMAEYALSTQVYRIEPIKLVVGLILFIFAVLELSPSIAHRNFDPKWIPLGGALSGFFGGLTGMQGALRSMFLVRSGLSKEAFVGTSVVCAMVVDLSRLLVYSQSLRPLVKDSQMWGIVVIGSLSALLGSVIGTRLIRKVTMETIQKIVGGLLMGVGLALAAGWI